MRITDTNYRISSTKGSKSPQDIIEKITNARNYLYTRIKELRDSIHELRRHEQSEHILALIRAQNEIIKYEKKRMGYYAFKPTVHNVKAVIDILDTSIKQLERIDLSTVPYANWVVYIGDAQYLASEKANFEVLLVYLIGKKRLLKDECETTTLLD